MKYCFGRLQNANRYLVLFLSFIICFISYLNFTMPNKII